MRKWTVVVGLLTVAVAGSLGAPLWAGGGQTPPHTEECQEELDACLSLPCGVFPGDGYTGAELEYQELYPGTFTDMNTGLTWQIKTGDQGLFVDCTEADMPDICFDVSHVNNQYDWSRDPLCQRDGLVFTFYLPMLNETCGGAGDWPCTGSGDCVGQEYEYCGLGGFTDWRLPTIKELVSLWNYADTDNPGIPGSLMVQLVWSSTERDDLYALGSYKLGVVHNREKELPGYVRAVRDDWDW